MIPIERRKRLVQLVEGKGIRSVSELSEILDVSEMTIRRDLGHLSRQGIVERIHGGAAKKANSFQSPFHLRVNLHRFEKEKIAKRAVQLIKDGDVVFFDPSTTTFSVVKNLPENISMTAITPGLHCAIELCNKPRVSIISIGGELDKQTISTIGSQVARKVREYGADKLFLSSHAIRPEEGVFERILSLVEIKRAMIRSSRKTILLADHTKFGFVSLLKVAPIEDIDVVVTDDKTSREHIRMLEQKGVEVLLA